MVSLLAVAETLTCVALYWLLWLKWGVTWHHWFIVAATPLVLMRSEASVKKGGMWFEDYLDNSSEHSLISARGISVLAASAALSFGVGWFLWQTWLVEFAGWPLFWRSVLLWIIGVNVGIAVLVLTGTGDSTIKRETMLVPVVAAGAGVAAEAGVLSILAAGIVAAFFVSMVTYFVAERRESGEPLILSSIAAGIFAGLWLRAIATRSMATFSHPLAGLKAIPTNWRLFVWHTDLLDPPELLPDHERTGFRAVISSTKVDGDWYPTGLILFSLAVPILYFPALIWRWSIKSTAWFYLPLLWVGRGWQNIRGEQLLIWAKGYSRKWLNIVGFLVAVILLTVSLVALIVPKELFDLQQTLKDAGAPLPVIGLAFVMDWQSLGAQPWQWFYLPSWVLTLMLFFLIDNQGTDIEKGAEAGPRLATLRRWMWVGNVRTVLTNLGLLTAMLYFLEAVDAWGQVTALLSSL